jgi:hypothetical protein
MKRREEEEEERAKLKVWRQDEITTTFAFASSIFIIDYISIYDHLLYSCLPRPSFPTSKGRYTNVDYSSAMSSPIFIRFLLHFSPPFLFSSSFFSCSAYRRGGSIAIADVRICRRTKHAVADRIPIEMAHVALYRTLA